MHHFAYRDGVLHAEAVSLDTLAAAVGTPFYCYSTATLTRHYKVFVGAFADVNALVCYAMKANSNQAVVATLAKLGAGAELGQGGDHRLVGIRLHGVADQRVDVGEGAGEHLVVPLQRGGRIAIEWGPDRRSKRIEANRLGVQHAVAISEVVHHTLSSARRREGFVFSDLWGPAAGRWSRRPDCHPCLLYTSPSPRDG